MASAQTVVLFKSVFTDKYVRPIAEHTPLNGRLSADGKGDPKFYLERASTRSTGSVLYHIKSFETNKYWQLSSANNLWITADADAPRENNSSECTLFEIEYFVAPVTPATTATAGTTTTVRILHHYLRRYVCLYMASDDYPYCLYALSGTIDKDSKDVFVCEELKFN